MMKCKSTMEFGDDFGDNSCTFHCQLESGHEGRHKESGALYNRSYSVEWE